MGDARLLGEAPAFERHRFKGQVPPLETRRLRSDSIRDGNCGAVGTVLFLSFCGLKRAGIFLRVTDAT